MAGPACSSGFWTSASAAWASSPRVRRPSQTRRQLDTMGTLQGWWGGVMFQMFHMGCVESQEMCSDVFFGDISKASKNDIDIISVFFGWILNHPMNGIYWSGKGIEGIDNSMGENQQWWSTGEVHEQMGQVRLGCLRTHLNNWLHN